MAKRLLRPTERGQITIPKEAREKLNITPDSRFKVSVAGNKIVYELVSPLDLAVREIQAEAKARGYSKKDLENELEQVRKKLFEELYDDENNG
ncbi:MAG: Looped-hinge helix DNA binding domain, AbrB family [Thermotogales bacterium 46_20]|nr:MAG: Looped-hinge helix DNA binding domain, AbrB family [Thermotogales bacterium 46_20]